MAALHFRALEKRETKVRLRRGDIVTFSPMREKVTKERIFVRIALPPYSNKNDTVVKAATDAHSSGGIVMLSAQM